MGSAPIGPSRIEDAPSSADGWTHHLDHSGFVLALLGLLVLEMAIRENHDAIQDGANEQRSADEARERGTHIGTALRMVV